MPQMALLVLLGYLDRTNIGNARVFGFEEDTGMRGTDFNNISMYFYIPYVLFETPWVIAVKTWGPGRVLALAVVAWSAITIGTGFVHSYGQTIAVRVMLGFFEAGLFPALTFTISQIYPARSQAKRVAVLYITIALSGALGGLFAYGIQSMGSRHGLSAWRWLFIVEGVISLVLGLVCWVSLPASPETAWFLNEEEKRIVMRIKERNHPYKETASLDVSQVAMALKDPFLYLASAALFCSSIALFGFGTFLPTLLRGMGYTALEANYLSIPVYIFASISTAITTFVSDRLSKRAVCLIHTPLLGICGYAIVVGTGHKAAGFFAMFLAGAGIYPFNTVLVTWVSNNTQPDSKRSIVIALLISLANASGLASSQIYPSYDAPRYVKGNAISLAGEAVALLCVGLLYALLKYRMREKKRLLDESKESNGKQGDRSLRFQYVF
ncbi:major facilitator superfamily transporter [Emericellopsis atlantica]|uniref:Major facilitator superfamily transporter n=1 Tax=Emericellopsis atlantica TaxID=2614577 RepID=A0A9P7ZK94_9HYPO|nr:major facilitator superfamily transporter [Emericellopsis atlantica]KAG9253654.1 major facilitator superfamily transporter [Emericellopsis atlantica]